MTNAKATIGHNNPPDPIDEALAPWGDHITEAEGWLDGDVVKDEGQLAATDELLKAIKAALKDLNAARDESTRPLHEAWKAEVARWKPTQDDLDRLIKGIVAAQDPFKRELTAKKEAEKRAAWEEANRKRLEAEKAAEAARATDIDAQREADRLRAEAMAAEAAASAKAKDRVKGMRTVHHYEITDHRAALNWIAKNDRDAVTAFIEEYVAKNHKAATIEGVRCWTEKEAF